ncbi:hypothetical protein [Actinoplanes sp. L3-i22]|uniref:hypothetical protein n=1 Tax=Actinoplanes sp. L3-i22 TaxID=2836373 RepID=UPI001C754D76|nr:hypothetical protein [Actinoplanes sp. L3-i22]BCY06079.1 hypothetical protein L3i22_011670 [Actinoplanes sp. L3-i22]
MAQGPHGTQLLRRGREPEKAVQNWSQSSAKAAHSGERAKPVATGAGLLEFEVIHEVTK